jgi:hypothetical protein
MPKSKHRQSMLVAVATAVLMCAAGTAQAGDRGHRDGYGRHHGYAQQRHYRHAPRHHRYRSSHRRHHHDGRHAVRTGLKVAAGAVLLGSIIHAVSDNRRERVVYRTRTVNARNDVYYRIDPDGECVEVTHNRQGQEVWTYVDPTYCN